MSVLEWLMIVGISFTVLTCLMSIYFILLLLRKTIQLQKLSKSPPKKQKRRRQWQVQRKSLGKKRKQIFKRLLLSVVLLLLFSSGTMYVNYYQSTNLSMEDADNVSRLYYLLRDFNTMIEQAAAELVEQTELERDIQYLATNIASYGSYSANNLNTVEGQTALNRYYKALGQMGMNASRQVKEFYGNRDLLLNYQTDVEKIMAHEEKVFIYYEVDENSLSESIETAETS